MGGLLPSFGLTGLLVGKKKFEEEENGQGQKKFDVFSARVQYDSFSRAQRNYFSLEMVATFLGGLLFCVCWIYTQRLLLFFFRATARRLVTLLVTQYEKFPIPMLPVATLAKKKTTTACWVRFSTFASCYLPTNPKRGPNEANRKFIIIQRKTLCLFSTPKMGATTIPPFSRTRKRLVGAVPFRGYIRR